jgi:hypothetical protein
MFLPVTLSPILQCVINVVLLCVVLQGVLHWEAVEAAIKSGRHSVTGILAHISKYAAPNTVQQQQQQPYLVTRAHLGRSLKAWCDEGRLVKLYRNWYDLPGPEL